eukprot:GHVS01074639.1.p1 GENE.GHVS01074639.1~~GHVS01074639.1.p1  ORF type:complete len:361 (+),score=62.06 GHVS01074639.1:356-1438(+)
MAISSSSYFVSRQLIHPQRSKLSLFSSPLSKQSFFSSSSVCNSNFLPNSHRRYKVFAYNNTTTTTSLSCSSSSCSSWLFSSPPPTIANCNVRHFSGAPKPTWELPSSQMFHPQIPDKHHYMEHPAMSGPVLWWRACRPYIEKAGLDVYKTSYRVVVEGVCEPIVEWWVKHNPEFRLQIVALVSFFVVQYCLTSYFTNYFQSIVDIRNTVNLLHAKELDEKHFFDSESEIMERKSQEYAEDHRRLTDIWEEALHTATVERSFDVLCDRLKLSEDEQTAIKPYRSESNTFRFNMIPYGKDNEHTQTFPVPEREKPLRSFSLNFTYSNLSGDWGDYVDRKDNKSAPLRHARPMFTDVYIPGTK